MRPVAPAWLTGAALTVCGWGQPASVKVYSAFQRIDPFGQVVSMDRARRADIKSREILSPAIGRNGNVAFHVVVTAPPDQDFTLYIGQNPDDYFEVSLYKELYVQQGGEWVPDGLEPVKLPYAGRLPERWRPIPGQKVVTFLMDVRAPAGAQVQRVKLEPELFADGRWIIYPMEVRVVSTTVPEHTATAVPLAAIGQPADATARAAVRSYLCGSPAVEPAAEKTVRWFIMRDAMQDMAVAKSKESSVGSRILPIIARGADPAAVRKWCESPSWPEDMGPEWYLRIRDAFHREY